MVLVNGQVSQSIPITDRGLNYGDGLFETIAVLKYKPVFWRPHLHRLSSGCERLGITPPDPELLLREVKQIIHIPRGVLKILISRRYGGRGYQGVPHSPGNRIISIHAWPDYPVEFTLKGIKAHICEMRLAKQPALAGVKHLNRLEQVLAAMECQRLQTEEGIMLDTDGYVTEGSKTNLFLVNQGVLYTPDIVDCGVAGIIRQEILAIAQENKLPYHISRLEKKDLEQADEVFVCNSIIGIWPVQNLAGIFYKKSEITMHLQTELQRRMERDIDENKVF